MRTRLRKRIRQGFFDIELLQDELSDDDIEKISTSFGPENLEDFGGEELALALRSTVALVYRFARAGELDPDQIIKDGIAEGKRSRVAHIRQKLEESPGSLTLNELELLHKSGELDEAEYEELFKSALGGPRPGVVFGGDDVKDLLAEHINDGE